jgi:hypothetical protein
MAAERQTFGWGKHKRVSAADAAAVAAQDWLPLGDIQGGCLLRTDGAVIGGMAIAPLPLELKSARETAQIISTLHAVLNGLSVPWEILSTYRPVDLDPYLNALAARVRAAPAPRQRVLQDYRQWVSGLAHSGSAVERRYYLLITRTGPEAVKEHRSTLPALSQDLERRGHFPCRGCRGTIHLFTVSYPNTHGWDGGILDRGLSLLDGFSGISIVAQASLFLQQPGDVIPGCRISLYLTERDARCLTLHDRID